MTEAPLPLGWTLTALGEVVQPSSAKVEPSECGDPPYIGLEHIESGTRRLLGHGYARDVKSTKALFRRGDVLYGKLRPYLRKVWRAEFDGVCSTDILVYPQSKAVDSGFLAYLLTSAAMTDHAVQASAGINLPRVNASTLGEATVALPPLAEQRRIVAKLDELLASSRAARAALDAVPALLERYRQSVLAAAFRGDLTAEWRGDDEPRSVTPGELPGSWRPATLADLCTRVSVGHVGPTTEHYCDPSQGVPFVRSQNVRPGRLSMDCVQYITQAFHAALKKSQLQAGDLLVVRVGANRGDTCVVPEGFQSLNCANIVFARPPAVLSRWVELYCQSAEGQNALLNMTSGSAQGVLNTSSVARLCVPTPPDDERLVVQSRVQAILRAPTAVAQCVSGLSAQIRQVDEAASAKAFRGELVPQDPADEPAPALLARLRAERASTPNARARRAPARA